MKLSLGFSPCPNDTFIFDSLVNGKLDTQGIEWEVHLQDVQTLNEWARQGKLDVTKVSYGVLPAIYPQYRLLTAGGAMGFGVGPLLIGNNPLNSHLANLQTQVSQSSIAVPGQDTTAHFLLTYAFGAALHKQFMPFHEIEDWVKEEQPNETRLGVIIHEGRFTYAQKGLHAWLDLGSHWEQQTGWPIPLGGIAIKRNVAPHLYDVLNPLIKASIALSWQQYPQVSPYVQAHAQDMQAPVIRNHIELYVNEFSNDVGAAGRAAVVQLMRTLQPSQNWQDTQLF